MSLANKFLRYFHRVHFGENKKHNLVPSHLPQNQSWLYRHLEQWNNIDWWVVVKGGGGDWEGLSGISPSYRVIAVECDMQMSHSEFVYSCQLALSSSLTWKQHVVVVVAYTLTKFTHALTHATSWENPAGFVPFFEQKIQGLFKDFQGHISHFSFLLPWSSRDHWLKVTKLCLAWRENLDLWAFCNFY